MIFFFDLDGTLLNYDKQITPRTMEALCAFADAGHKIVVNTGRPVESGTTVVRELGMPCDYVIGFNGAMITEYKTGKVLQRHGIPVDLVRGVFEITAAHGVYCQTYNDEVILTTTPGETLDYYRRIVKTPVKVTDDIFAELTDAPCKCLAIELAETDKLEAVRKDVLAMAKGALTAVYSSRRYLEIFSSAAGKGKALTTLCALLQIPVAEAYAAGDEQNDIPMLEAAGTGIAMRNAKDFVKAAAKLVTKEDNEHDGLAEILFTLAGKK